jgi:hypothetical protein
MSSHCPPTSPSDALKKQFAKSMDSLDSYLESIGITFDMVSSADRSLISEYLLYDMSAREIRQELASKAAAAKEMLQWAEQCPVKEKFATWSVETVEIYLESIQRFSGSVPAEDRSLVSECLYLNACALEIRQVLDSKFVESERVRAVYA